MAIRFRKSINLGKGFRINMSKSGSGFSWGGKGFRLTKKAGGGFRGTAYIPGTGLSYQKDFKSPFESKLKKTSSRKKQVKNKLTNDKVYEDAQNFGIDFKNLKSTALEDVLADTSKQGPINYIGTFLFVLGLILTFRNLFFIILAIIGAFLHFYKSKTPQINIDYDFEADSKKDFDLSNDLLAGILESDGVFLVKSLAAKGANFIILDREDIRVSKRLADGISTNVDVISLECGDYILSFLPDCLLINEGSLFKALDYKDIDVDLRAERFLEEELIKDARLVEKTFLYTNKDGSPDKRYKDNPKINLVEYGVLEMVANNLAIMIVFSDTLIDGK